MRDLSLKLVNRGGTGGGARSLRRERRVGRGRRAEIAAVQEPRTLSLWMSDLIQVCWSFVLSDSRSKLTSFRHFAGSATFIEDRKLLNGLFGGASLI